MGEPLVFNQETAAVALAINNSDETMLLRELQQNALDAIRVSGEDGTVTWMVKEINEVPKLCVVNNGQSMSCDELLDLLRQIGRTGGGKLLGVGKNFGRGAKLTILKAYREGAIYESCKNGTVCAAQLAWSYDGVPELRAFDMEDGTQQTVIDVTDEYTESMRSTDWVSVTLMGDSPEHNTTTHPLGEPMPAYMHAARWPISTPRQSVLNGPGSWG